ncbi:MAG: hypothetical protein U9P79_07140 [Candidatus Cloacimonadota bacterium]|nr:hypothetical protein [Candidatus Cloacimonadota bacterium]
MFKPKRPIGFRKDQKHRVPPAIWILLILSSIFGMFLSRYCSKQMDTYLIVQSIEIEQQGRAYAQISFEIENLATFSVDRKVVVRLYSGNLELGSKMIMAQLESEQKKGFFVTVEFIKILDKDESVDEISVRFYD